MPKRGIQPDEITESDLKHGMVKAKRVEIKHVGYEQESSVIKEAVWDRVGSVGPSSEILVRIAESLSLNSNMEILIEAVALEKLKENAEQAEITTEVECIDKLIALVTHMYRRLKWIDLGITVCPKTRKTLAHTLSIPNYTMKALIANGCETKNVKLPDPMESTSLNQVYPLRATEVKNLSVIEVHRARIGRFGAIQPLVDLLGNGTPRGKKDATSALFNLSLFHENKGRIVQAGMVDKAVVLLANLATIPEGRTANAQEGGIPRLVEVVELGSARGKEHASAALLYLCTCSSRSCSVVLQEGAVPPLVALSRSGTPRAKEKGTQPSLPSKVFWSIMFVVHLMLQVMHVKVLLLEVTGFGV
ncbi:hypothetical protein Godav_020579 [Gossypium davidsonii]|uniref:Uncharacterized protein n=1 Tax=Gossypium davidsonii TaxID=34287 RepID=A0A7J8R3E6_GOSDV|nr:hypothetical protein [Gossypium davidsonii]